MAGTWTKDIFSLHSQEIVCNSHPLSVLSCTKSISPVHDEKTIKLTQEGRCSPLCCQQIDAQRQGEGKYFCCSSAAWSSAEEAVLMCKHSAGEQTGCYLFLYFSRLCNGGQWEELARIIYLLFFHSLIPPRQENKSHQHHTKRLKGWLPGDGEQPQPAFTLPARWTALPQYNLPPFPWTLPASR